MSKTAEELTRKHCVPCEGGIPALPPEQAQEYLKELPRWQLSADGKSIHREWRVKNFRAGLDFRNRIGKVEKTGEPGA
ncbi:MAG: 4a-hydroxytetrahydrobiopterin dehydratase [Gemmataceae bacterium]|nr:4a-hydroxytetrahydrobiopterin dehydratase [Gemmataceae bacterium]